MDRHIADNLTYYNVLNDMMTQRIEGYINNAAERRVLDSGDKADKELYETSPFTITCRVPASACHRPNAAA